MSNYPNSQYIVMKSDGTTINYYFHGDFGICSSVLSSSGKWNNAVSNAEDAKKDYSIGIDVQNTVYIVYRNQVGSIKVIVQNGKISKTVDILQSKNTPDYNMFPQILPLDDNCHVFYIVENAGKKIICHQSVKAGKPLPPTAVDYINYNPQYAPYSIAHANGQIFLLYAVPSESGELPGYKTFEPSAGKWGKFVPLSKPSGTIYSPVISSYDNRILILYVKKYEDATYIVRRSVSETDASLLPEQETVRCIDSEIYPQVLMSQEEDIIYWREDRQIKYVALSGTIKNPVVKTLEFADRSNILHFNVVANTNQKTLRAWLLPGNFSNGLTLGFIKMPGAPRSEPKSGLSFSTLSTEYKAFELMQSKIADLEKKIRLLGDRVSALEKKSGG